MREIMECKKNILGGGRHFIKWLSPDRLCGGRHINYFTYLAPIGFRMKQSSAEISSKKIKFQQNYRINPK